MTQVPFAQLPSLVKVTSLATILMAWVLLAEFVIDRHGFDEYLPFYRVGNLCPYELAVLLLLLGVWRRLHRNRATSVCL